MKLIRKLHFWLGVLFAPTIFFFALTGALQILGLHEGEGASPLIARLAMIHKDQRVGDVERRAPKPDAKPPAAKPLDAKPPDAAADHDAPTRARPPAPHRSTLLVVFFLMMSVGLMLSTALGVYMAFGYRRDRRVIFGLLAAGIALPVLGLFL